MTGSTVYRFVLSAYRSHGFPVVFRSTILLCVSFVLARQTLTAESIEQQIAAHFRAGVEAFRAGWFDRAVEEYKAVLQLDPALAEAHVNLGLAYHSLGQYKLAIAGFERGLSAKPEIASANLFLGIDYLKLGLSAKAIPHLQATLRAQPANREALRALATCDLDEERYQDAADQFRILSSLETDKSEALYLLAHGYLDLAKHAADRLSQHYQNTLWASRLAGDLLTEGLRWTDAALLYRQALKIEGNQPEIHVSLGKIFLGQGDLRVAQEHLQNALKLDPRNEAAWLGMAEVELAKGAASSALDCLDKIWEIFPPFLAELTDFPSMKLGVEKTQGLVSGLERLPGRPARCFLLATLYRASGAQEKAYVQAAAFEKDLSFWREEQARLNEPLSDACEVHQYLACVKRLERDTHRGVSGNLMLGEALFVLADDTRAAGAFGEGLAQSRESAAVRYWLVRVYKRLASRTFAELVEKFPGSVRAYEFRAESDQLREAYDDALRDYQTAIGLRPDDPELHEKLSQVYLEKKLFLDADQELKTAIELDPRRSRSLYLMGRSRLSQHQERDSLPFLQKALQIEPGLLEARAALGQAYMRLKQPARALPQLEEAASIDFHGDLHYLLYVCYRDLGRKELAQKALARSQELRKNLVAKQQARIVDIVENEGESK
jgi:tetratricopeptide (TPR) repeat protein